MLAYILEGVYDLALSTIRRQMPPKCIPAVLASPWSCRLLVTYFLGCLMTPSHASALPVTSISHLDLSAASLVVPLLQAFHLESILHFRPSLSNIFKT